MCNDYQEISSKVVTTRKPHRCEWCGQRIEAGEKAYYRAYKFDGDLRAGWMHPECEKASAEAPHDEICEGWNPGDYKRGTTIHVDC